MLTCSASSEKPPSAGAGGHRLSSSFRVRLGRFFALKSTRAETCAKSKETSNAGECGEYLTYLLKCNLKTFISHLHKQCKAFYKQYRLVQFRNQQVISNKLLSESDDLKLSPNNFADTVLL